MRRALSHQGGATETRGQRALSRILAQAMRAPERAPDDDLTHGFHSYPARMHPAIARKLIAELATPPAHVLDPFCGSGTVLVEAMAAGCRARGSDLSPIALRVAELHTALVGPGGRRRFGATVEALAEVSEERVRARVPARAPLQPDERQWYSPHVLLELAGLWEEIGKVEHDRDRTALEMVFSSLLVKFSNQRANTVEEPVQRRLRKGLVTEAFLARGRELVERWEALSNAVPRGVQPPRLLKGDVRALPHVLGPRYRADLILTSPPYGGTYDYLDHHVRRYPWLGMSTGNMQRFELGARRHLSAASDGVGRWDAQVRDALVAMAKVRAPEGLIVLLIGDAQVGRRRVDAGQQIRRIAPELELKVVASARQERPDQRGGRPRGEHLLAIR